MSGGRGHLHEHVALEGVALHALPDEAEHREAGVACVAGVVIEEVRDDARGDDPPHVLDVAACEALERDADEAAVLVKHRAAAVAAVDGRVDLHAEQLRRAMHVCCHL